MEPFLSIVIPVYKIKEEYLRKCFDSLIEQDMDSFQVVIVDDGSPDRSGEICDEYAVKDSRFIVIHQGNRGVSVARNVGIKSSNTQWITFVDPDDWVEPDLVSNLYRLQKENSADIYLYDYYQEFADNTNVKYLKGESGVLDSEWVKNFKLAPFNHLVVNGSVYEYETNTIWNKMYRATLIKNNQLQFEPEAKKGQDVIFNAEALQYTESYFYFHKALYHYRYLQGSVTNRFNSNAMKYNEIAFDYYEKIIEKFGLPDTYWEAYYARVVTRLYSCMRLYYFHPENMTEYASIKVELDKALNRYPYNTALEKVDFAQLTFVQKVFVWFLKKRQYGAMKLLVNMWQMLRKAKGVRLK